MLSFQLDQPTNQFSRFLRSKIWILNTRRLFHTWWGIKLVPKLTLPPVSHMHAIYHHTILQANQTKWYPQVYSQELWMLSTTVQCLIAKVCLVPRADLRSVHPRNTQHLLYFWLADDLRMSKIIFPNVQFTNTGLQIQIHKYSLWWSARKTVSLIKYPKGHKYPV